MSLTLEQILTSDDRSTVAVECPEWGGTCYVRTLSADERDAWEIAIEETDRRSVRATLVAVALCDKTGKSLKPTDAQIAGLGQKASGPMDRLFDAVMKLNKMRKVDVEQLEKNSEPTAEQD